jgi:hypothetical protein
MVQQLTVVLLWILLLWSTILVARAGTLPDDFSLRFHATGADLVWYPVDKKQVRIGGARPEFRYDNGKVLGYPFQDMKEGTLVLPLETGNQGILTAYGQNLEVWMSGKRIDQNAPSAGSRIIDDISPPSITTNISTTPTINIDPATPGNYTMKRLSYNMRRGLNYSKFPSRIEVIAEVRYPEPFPTSPSPLVLFLHGHHGTCYDPKYEKEDCKSGWPCDPGCVSIPSHNGYRYLTNILASNGYITISISANGISGQDFRTNDGGVEARSLLIRRHLNLWARWNNFGTDPWGGLFRGKVDLNNVVLVGHSRGGEVCIHRSCDSA